MSDATLALIAAFIKETQDALMQGTEPHELSSDLINIEDSGNVNTEEESSSL